MLRHPSHSGDLQILGAAAMAAGYDSLDHAQEHADGLRLSADRWESLGIILFFALIAGGLSGYFLDIINEGTTRLAFILSFLMLGFCDMKSDTRRGAALALGTMAELNRGLERLGFSLRRGGPDGGQQ